jgi:hypothetical protein
MAESFEGLGELKLEQQKASRRYETQGLRMVERLLLQERGEEKARGAFHPKCRNGRKKKGNLHPFFPFFFSL